MNNYNTPVCADCHKPIYTARIKNQKRCRICQTIADREWDKAYLRRTKRKHH